MDQREVVVGHRAGVGEGDLVVAAAGEDPDALDRRRGRS